VPVSFVEDKRKCGTQTVGIAINEKNRTHGKYHTSKINPQVLV